jgi:hypothetical protein
MKDRLERIWKEVVMDRPRYYPGIFLEGLSHETSGRTADVQGEIRTWHLSNMNVEPYG